MLKLRGRSTDERSVPLAPGALPTDSGTPDQPASLDVHALAALDRLTRWAAKALRAPAAVVTLAEGGLTVAQAISAPRTRWRAHACASSSGRSAPADSRWRSATCGRARAACGRSATTTRSPSSARRCSTDDDTVVGSFCITDTRPRRWTIQDVELVNELTSSAMTELELHAARDEAQREKRWSDRQQAVLELIAAQAPLATHAERAARTPPTPTLPGMLAAITRLTPVRGAPARLRVIAGRGLPREFTSTLDGVPVGRAARSAAPRPSAASRSSIADIAKAELSPWFVELASATASAPAGRPRSVTRSGAVLGTFTIYFRRRASPNERDRTSSIVRCTLHSWRSSRSRRRGAAPHVTRARSLAREQTALQRVATRVADATEPQVLFSVVAEQAARLLKAEAGYVLRFEDEARHRSMGSWARVEARLLPDTAIHGDDLGEQVRNGRCARAARRPGRRRARLRAPHRRTCARRRPLVGHGRRAARQAASFAARTRRASPASRSSRASRSSTPSRTRRWPSRRSPIR